jgi:hypothetical protein
MTFNKRTYLFKKIQRLKNKIAEYNLELEMAQKEWDEMNEKSED